MMKKFVKKSLMSLVLCAVFAVTPTIVGGGCNLNGNSAETSVTNAQARIMSELFSSNGGDIDYENDTDILTVCQEQNKLNNADTNDKNAVAWERVGYNATLGASFKGATKLECNSLGNLAFYLDEADRFGNLSVNSDGYLKGKTSVYAGADVYSESAPVYKDIDIVNVDIATGEIIGKLSNPAYNFEWFGREITLPSGTTLASGRTLTNAETFTVDVYTYYPTMYIYRRVIAKEVDSVTKYYQTISLAGSGTTTRNQQLIDEGFVKIDAYYTATFQATVFNPDKTVAHNSYGIITRSYAYDRGVLTSGSSNYYATNWGYKNSYVDETSGSTISITSGANNTNSTTQTNMLNWANNLTKAWADYKTNHSSTVSGKTFATGCQGENYTAFIYNLLYLVKYANNNSQNSVGKGNGWAYGTTNGKSVTNTNGTELSMNGYYDGEIGGSTIGVRNANKVSTCSYINLGTTETPNYVQSAYGYNTASMNYGYNSNYTYTQGYNDGADKKGLYNVQFLTHTANSNGVATKRYLLDGYVGSDQYTSVFCLGMSNVWANVWTWVYGTATSYDGTNLNMYVTYDNYTETKDGTITTKNWIMDNSATKFREALTTEDKIVTQNNSLKYNISNYNKININMPTSGYWRYMGTDSTTSGSKNSLIGLPVQNDDTHTSTSASDSSGLTDYFYSNKSSSNLFGCLRGGNVHDNAYAGAFTLDVNHGITGTYVSVGFRSMLVL